MIRRIVFIVILLLLSYWCGPFVLILPVLGYVNACCCSSCTIFTDDFSTNRLSTDYTTVSGTGAVLFGTLRTTSTNYVVVENTSGTTGHGRVTARAKASTSGSSFGVVGSYVASNNNVFCEITLGGASSTFKLWRRFGTDTQLGSTYTFTAATNTDYTVELCWRGGSVTASIIGDASSVITAKVSASGNKAGMKAISASGGTITFSSFTYSKEHIDDNSCQTCGDAAGYITCDGCQNDTGPKDGFDVLVAGVTNSTCTNCTSIFNALHVCSYYVSELPGSMQPACSWSYPAGSIGATCCDAGNTSSLAFYVYLYQDGGTLDYYLDVVMAHCTGGAIPGFTGQRTATFRYNFGATKPDCRDISGLVVPFLSQSGTSTPCDFSGATVTVTSNV